MSHKELTSYIQKQQAQSVPREKIVESLEAAGWYHADINRAFAKVQSENTANTVANQNMVPEATNTFATVALVLGICGVLTAALLPVSITGIIFGILALRKPGQKTTAIWGLSLSALAFVLGLIFWVCFALGLFSAFFGHHGYYYNNYNYNQPYPPHAPSYNSYDYRDQNAGYKNYDTREDSNYDNGDAGYDNY